MITEDGQLHAHEGMAVRPLPEVLRKVLLVPLTPDQAFNCFVEHVHEWWSPGATADPELRTWRDMRIEGKVGGRWFQVSADGATHKWGSVLEWSPPSRLAVAWEVPWRTVIGGGELELTFFGTKRGQSRIVLEHRLPILEDQLAAAYVSVLDKGWTGLMLRYSRFCGRRAHAHCPEK